MYLIDENTSWDSFNPAAARHGAVPRDFSVDPVEMFASPHGMPLYPRSEWSARIKVKVEQKSRLSDLRETMANGSWHRSLDQNGQGYCWFYSVTSTVMFARARDMMPYVRLSAHGGACKVKNFRDEGGWCGLGAKFVRENGVPSVEAWPEKSMSRSNDNAATWADAAKYKIVEDWVDLSAPVYDQNLTFEQVASCLLNNIPCAVDFNWWGHSVCALDLVEVEPGDFGLLIINSWTDQWGDRGMGVLRGARCKPDGAVATRVVMAA
jgi:hypothetical protein